MGVLNRPASTRAAIILAGGEGVRLRSVTRFITGQDDVPKQFCPMLDGVTWFENTLARVAQTFPLDHCFVVVKEKHRQFYEPLINDLPRSQIVVQPSDRGTAPAILYGMFRAKRLGPDTTVTLFPCDHHVSDNVRFSRQVSRALDAVDEHPSLAVLLGVMPDRIDTSYGWIEPAARVSSWTPDLFHVKRFWEKPRLELARTLLAGGCLWNTAIISARVSLLEAIIAEHAPDLYRSFCAALDQESSERERLVLDSLYEKLESVGFSEQVLSLARSSLAVQLVDDVQWSDLGEPQRLIDTFRALEARPAWFEDFARIQRRMSMARPGLN
jgi:mannose-1-phosphate guanylyltransferase